MSRFTFECDKREIFADSPCPWWDAPVSLKVNKDKHKANSPILLTLNIAKFSFYNNFAFFNPKSLTIIYVIRTLKSINDKHC